jgi:Fe-S cluster assembly iron-binding protein IscA
LALALDESKETDNVYDINGITYLIDKTLAEQAKEVKVDFVDHMGRSGFSVSSVMNLGGGSSCGTSCSC